MIADVAKHSRMFSLSSEWVVLLVAVVFCRVTNAALAPWNVSCLDSGLGRGPAPLISVRLYETGTADSAQARA
jgi:hypothetical protein